MRYFIAVAETRHFGRAAVQLSVTQPPLSRQIAALEKDLGVRLFERHSRQVLLTPAGERFLADARGVVAAFDEACRNARLADAGELGALTVGFMMHAAYGSVPPLARRFMALHPGVQLHLRETLPSQILEAVGHGDLDAGITFAQSIARGLAAEPIYREPLVLVVPESHRLAQGRGEVDGAELEGEGLVAVPEAVVPSLRQAIDRYCERSGHKPLIRLETQLQQTIVSLVAEGIGVALVPRSLERLGMGGVLFRALVDPPQVEQMLVWRNANRNPVLPHFLAVARKEA